MTKFKVGDKVRFIEDYMDYKKGDTVEVIGFWDEGINYIGKGKLTGCYFSRVELVETKPTKNQRITALENEVKRLDKFSEGLRGALTGALKRIESLEAKLVEKVAVVEKTANEQRAEMIEKAKDFIVKSKFANKFYEVPNGPFGYFHCDVEFIMNEQKRTVVALMRSTNNKSIKAKGIAKCMPDDVFNEHIGKAIALGRALGIDVSEFEQAVQPTEIVIGQIVKIGLNGIGGVALKSNKENYSVDYAKRNNLTIINDTNAIYGGVE